MLAASRSHEGTQNRREIDSSLSFDAAERAITSDEGAQKLRTLRERHQQAETKRKRDEALQAKKDDARRKELVAKVVLEKVERGEIAEAQFRKWMDGALAEPSDRALFKL